MPIQFSPTTRQFRAIITGRFLFLGDSPSTILEPVPRKRTAFCCSRIDTHWPSLKCLQNEVLDFRGGTFRHIASYSMISHGSKSTGAHWIDGGKLSTLRVGECCVSSMPGISPSGGPQHNPTTQRLFTSHTELRYVDSLASHQ